MKILFVLPRVPYPLEKGDKLRAFHFIKQLAKNHEVVLFCLNDVPLHPKAISTLQAFCSDIHIVPFSKWKNLMNLSDVLWKKMPLQVTYFYSKKAQQEFDRFYDKHRPDRVYCQLIRMAPYLEKYSQLHKQQLTLDYMDVFSKGAERWASKSSLLFKPVLRIEYKYLVQYETKVFDWFKNKIIISAQDRDWIQHPQKRDVRVIPNGVDTGYFKPQDKEKDFDILFNGNMNYPPNIESVEYLVHQILPEVKKVIPQVRVLISGANPHTRVLALKSDSVVISGWMEDIRNSFARSRILVAPMQISIGLQNKLLEAMSMKLPCVTSSLANNAIKAVPGKEIFVADTPQDYAKAIIGLLQTPALATTISENAYRLVVDYYDWNEMGEKLERLMIE